MAAAADVSTVTTTTGVIGRRWRGDVSAWGSLTPWGGDRTLDWYVAADDRWHVPAVEPAVRQRRIDGTPVTETRVRIPDGDAVQRVWSVADGGGLTIVEIENDSPLPFAVAFSGLDVLTERPPSPVPIQGIDLPDDAVLLPVGHHARVRVAVPHGAAPAALTRVADAAAVVRGWTALAARGSRLDVPDVGLVDAMVAARCDLQLAGPIDVDDDPLGFVLDVGELVRCGAEADAEAWLVEIVPPLENMARSGDPLVGPAIAAARRVAIAAGDPRAAGDLERLMRRVTTDAASRPLTPFSEVERGRSLGRFVEEIERRVATGGALLPIGIPSTWLGANVEFHGIPTSVDSAVSFALRWHGERPAVLWEQHGTPLTLTAPTVDAGWSSVDAAGEALWAAPRRAGSLRVSVADEPAPEPAPGPVTPSDTVSSAPRSVVPPLEDPGSSTSFS